MLSVSSIEYVYSVSPNRVFFFWRSQKCLSNEHETHFSENTFLNLALGGLKDFLSRWYDFEVFKWKMFVKKILVKIINAPVNVV